MRPVEATGMTVSDLQDLPAPHAIGNSNTVCERPALASRMQRLQAACISTRVAIRRRDDQFRAEQSVCERAPDRHSSEWTVERRVRASEQSSTSDTSIGVPSIGAWGGPGPPSFFENLQTGPPSFLKNNRLLDGLLK